jgi:phenylalanyl-tRNA synthetase alpha chain
LLTGDFFSLKKEDGGFGMKQKLEEIKKRAIEEIENSEGLDRLNEVRQSVLGKKGELTAVLKGMKDVAPEDRPKVGQWVNETRETIDRYLSDKTKKLEAEALRRKYESEKIDVTMPAVTHEKGSLHPVTQVRNQLIDIFASMGFEVFEGTEIETDYYNFTALNTPLDHPARDMQDTFYLSPEFLLRTQTSAGQIHVMEAKKPPIKVVSPGKVFRSDDDATHSPMFTQMEGLVVDKGITLCDLKGMLDEFVKKIFGKEMTTRLRPSYFPFTEPSVEVDVSCFQCGGCGCKLCKGTGWIEVLGAGVVNNKVLEGCKIDTSVYSGFAFGIGIERIAMLKYGINNIKLLFESDLRVLKQIDD